MPFHWVAVGDSSGQPNGRFFPWSLPTRYVGPRQAKLRNVGAGWSNPGSERLDRSFRLHQDRDPITDRVHSPAFVTLEAVIPS